MNLFEPSGIVAARRIPADCRAKLSVSNPSPLQVRVAERRNSQPRNAATVGLPCGETHPVSGRDCRPITRAGAPLGAPLRLFLKPRDRLLETDRGAHTVRPGFRRVFRPAFIRPHQPVAGRTHVVGPGSDSRGPRRSGWLGRTLRRRIRCHAPHENALGGWDRDIEHQL